MNTNFLVQKNENTEALLRQIILANMLCGDAFDFEEKGEPGLSKVIDLEDSAAFYM